MGHRLFVPLGSASTIMFGIRSETTTQSWRGSSYKETDEDSQIEVVLEAVAGGTNVMLTHTNVPDDQASHEPGWTIHYFEPMKQYFGQLRSEDAD